MSPASSCTLALAAVLLDGCIAGTSPGKAPGAADGAATGSGGSTPNATGSGGFVPMPTGSGGSDGGGITPDAPICSEQVHAAQPVPVDLLLLVDASSSMLEVVPGGRSKHDMVREALVAFVRDPRSAGLGVGLQFFPLPSETPCNSDADCGPYGGFGKREWWGCRVPTACAPPGAPIGTSLATCAPATAQSECSPPQSCVPLGYCSVTGWSCTAIGEVCKSGVAGDSCKPYPRVCNGAAICNPALFRKMVVPIADLPAAAGQLASEMTARESAGSTPMGPAVEAALVNLADRAASKPGRAGALVLVTDGLPDGCGAAGSVLDVIAGRLTTAATASPAVTTYVIGVIDGADPNQAAAHQALRRFSQAGATGAPFLLSPAADLTKTFLAALEQIRNRALPCEFTIPTSAVPTLDFGRVNLRFRGTTGETDILHVGSAARCDPARGGWYYDADPTSGATPTRVITCPASCAAFKKDSQGHIDLRFGCKTKVVE